MSWSVQEKPRSGLPPVSGSRFVTVSPLEVRRSEDTDHLDVGVVRLGNDDAQRLSAYKKFLCLAELDTGQRMPAGAYLVTGFPAQLTKIDHALKEITANRFSYLTHLAAVDNETPVMTLGLQFRSSILRYEDGSTVRQMPELKGISGCGIWRVWTESQTASLDRWDPPWIRLSGIEHAVIAHRSIRGTIIGHAIGIIARSYPELVPSIRLSLS